MIATEIDKMIITIALQILRKEEAQTPETIRTTVRHVMNMFREMKQYSDEGDVEEDLLVREIETLCNVYVPTMSTLDDMHDHQEWFSSQRAGIKWRFWERYQQYLEDDLRMPPQAVWRLD